MQKGFPANPFEGRSLMIGKLRGGRIVRVCCIVNHVPPQFGPSSTSVEAMESDRSGFRKTRDPYPLKYGAGRLAKCMIVAMEVHI